MKNRNKNPEYVCAKCGIALESSDCYEYRGAYSCAEHFDEVCATRDGERAQILAEESRKTEVLRGLDVSSESSVGRANRALLKPHIEVASQESNRLREYERPSEFRGKLPIGPEAVERIEAYYGGKLSVRTLTGRCADGYEKGRGVYAHAVIGGTYGESLCGKSPGKRSNGFSQYESDEVDCPLCIDALKVNSQ